MVLAARRATVTLNGVLTLLLSARLTTLMARVGSGGGGGAASSLVMVPGPGLSASVALLGVPRLTKKVSSASLTVSPVTLTVMVLEVSPGAKDSVPLAAV